MKDGGWGDSMSRPGPPIKVKRGFAPLRHPEGWRRVFTGLAVDDKRAEGGNR